jgi:hypothetical protein
MKKPVKKDIVGFSLYSKLKIGASPVNVGVNMIHHVQRVSFLTGGSGEKGEKLEIASKWQR